MHLGGRHVMLQWGATSILPVSEFILNNSSSIWTMQPLGKSYPLPDGLTNGKILKDFVNSITSCWDLIRTSEAFIHRDSFSIGLRQGFPTDEREYEWMCSESFPKQKGLCQNLYIYIYIHLTKMLIWIRVAYLFRFDMLLRGKLV